MDQIYEITAKFGTYPWGGESSDIEVGTGTQLRDSLDEPGTLKARFRPGRGEVACAREIPTR
jgi:hypothetical protein